MSDPMKPLSTDRPIAEGTPAWGADFNAAVSLLYRWWSLLDAPKGTDTSRLADDLVNATYSIKTPEFIAVDHDDLRAASAAAARSAHHLGHDDYRLYWIDGERFRLTADYTVQIDDRCERRSLVAILRKTTAGLFVFDRLDETSGAALPDAPFRSSYLDNRARATSTRFQAHMDSLSGDASRMRDLLMPVLELHGLVASKDDRSSAGGEALTDVDDLRKSVAGTDNVADNAIRDFAGFAAWFATAPQLFAYGLHKLEHLAVTPRPDRRFETVAQYEWVAETLNGARIETHHPLTWVFVDTDEPHMRIEKLLPF